MCAPSNKTKATVIVVLSASLSPLGENVPVGAPVLHGDAVATVWRVVAHGVEGAILVIVGNVLQHCCIPDETKMAIFHLENRKRNKKRA